MYFLLPLTHISPTRSPCAASTTTMKLQSNLKMLSKEPRGLSFRERKTLDNKANPKTPFLFWSCGVAQVQGFRVAPPRVPRASPTLSSPSTFS